jgi:hypothetical protein
MGQTLGYTPSTTEKVMTEHITRNKNSCIDKVFCLTSPMGWTIGYIIFTHKRNEIISELQMSPPTMDLYNAKEENAKNMLKI